MIIFWLLLIPRAWRVTLVCSHSILVSVIINYTNMAATSHMKLGFLVNFCEFFLNLNMVMKKKLVLYQALLRRKIDLGVLPERRRVKGWNVFLRISWRKNKKIELFFCIYVAHEVFIDMYLFQETCSAPRNS